jgi:hypothetical protein
MKTPKRQRKPQAGSPANKPKRAQDKSSKPKETPAVSRVVGPAIKKNATTTKKGAIRFEATDLITAVIGGDADAIAEIQECGTKLIVTLTIGILSGHPVAARVLLELIEHGVYSLNQWNGSECVQAELIRDLAATRTYWPAMLAPHEGQIAGERQRLHQIGLGSKTGIGYGNKRSFGWKGATAVSFHHQLLPWREKLTRLGGPKSQWEKLAAKLPVLTREKAVLRQWWKAMSAAFVDYYGEQFEHGQPFMGFWENHAVKQLAPHLQRARVRRDIMKAVKQGLHAIAPAN